MNDQGIENRGVTQFVRGVLGCSCPDKVFEDISVTRQSKLFGITNCVYEIGGRLIVAIVVPQDWQDVEPALGSMVEVGKKYRDRHGFNRFRLVVASDSDEAHQVLTAQFEALPDIDERLHLHVIEPQKIPVHVQR
ncbi:MAG: hypothetical protein JSW45_04345 [Thiotrichales bacterium]|nr:MAG: hypothetical protein JSW45_04345 [Thiotrichales bacterium]